jgi:hypothetical protein
VWEYKCPASPNYKFSWMTDHCLQPVENNRGVAQNGRLHIRASLPREEDNPVQRGAESHYAREMRERFGINFPKGAFGRSNQLSIISAFPIVVRTTLWLFDSLVPGVGYPWLPSMTTLRL